MQRIREAERDTIFNEYSQKLHDIVNGTVQRYEQRNMYVDLGRTEALLPLSEQVPRENYRINDRINAFVLDVRKTNKGPQIILSRAAEGLVQRLLEREVPEINDNIVEIMAIAREPGSRSKVAVHSHRPKSTPWARASVRSRAGSRPSQTNCAVKKSTSSVGRRTRSRSSTTRSRRPRSSRSSFSRTKASVWSPSPTTSSRSQSGAKGRTFGSRRV